MQDSIYSCFSKLELRVGEVVKAEKVEKSNKLLHLEVNFGPSLGTKSVVSGIAPFFEPEVLENKKYVFVYNIEKRRLFGLESEAMILVAEGEKNEVYLIEVPEAVPIGSKVR